MFDDPMIPLLVTIGGPVVTKYALNFKPLSRAWCIAGCITNSWSREKFAAATALAVDLVPREPSSTSLSISAASSATVLSFDHGKPPKQ